MFAPAGTSRSRSTSRRRLSCPTTRRSLRPCRRRTSAATDDLPDAEFPRKMINRVSPEPEPVTPAKLALFRAVSAVVTADALIGPKCGSCDEHQDARGAPWPDDHPRRVPLAADSGRLYEPTASSTLPSVRCRTPRPTPLSPLR